MQAVVLSALLVQTYGYIGVELAHTIATVIDPLVITRHEDKAPFRVLTAIFPDAHNSYEKKLQVRSFVSEADLQKCCEQIIESL